MIKVGTPELLLAPMYRTVFTQTLSVESGLNYELIRLGRYYYENTIPGNGSERGANHEGRYTIVNKFNYLSVPLNLSYRF